LHGYCFFLVPIEHFSEFIEQRITTRVPAGSLVFLGIWSLGGNMTKLIGLPGKPFVVTATHHQVTIATILWFDNATAANDCAHDDLPLIRRQRRALIVGHSVFM
jgi:hypothetical protein